MERGGVRADPRFLAKPKPFWASVRSLSQHIGYSREKALIVPTLIQMCDAFEALDLDPTALCVKGKPTNLGSELLAYFAERARVLTNYAEPRLMTAAKARALFLDYRKRLCPSCPIPMNKQKGDKRAEAYLTGLVNMIIESELDGLPVDYDPRELTTFVKDKAPIRTLARRVDGAFPSTVNPVAIWEVKEYYYTTTFGSRIADGVYETLLDGKELEEMRENTGIEVDHVLMIDAHYTWWVCGKPYLCRIFDMLHMGLVSEVLFGREVVEKLPAIVAGWKARVTIRD